MAISGMCWYKILFVRILEALEVSFCWWYGCLLHIEIANLRENWKFKFAVSSQPVIGELWAGFRNPKITLIRFSVNKTYLSFSLSFWVVYPIVSLLELCTKLPFLASPSHGWKSQHCCFLFSLVFFNIINLKFIDPRFS